jgi:hypothetical protein
MPPARTEQQTARRRSSTADLITLDETVAAHRAQARAQSLRLKKAVRRNAHPVPFADSPDFGTNDEWWPISQYRPVSHLQLVISRQNSGLRGISKKLHAPR